MEIEELEARIDALERIVSGQSAASNARGWLENAIAGENARAQVHLDQAEGLGGVLAELNRLEAKCPSWRLAPPPPNPERVLLADNGMTSGPAVCRRCSDFAPTPSADDGPLWFWAHDLSQPMRPQPIAWCEMPRYSAK